MNKDGGGLGVAIGVAFAIVLDAYFVFAAVQGDYGVFREVQVNFENEALREELKNLQEEVSHMENLTKRLSADYLDLDLLDERARDVLGVLHGSDYVLRDIEVDSNAPAGQGTTPAN